MSIINLDTSYYKIGWIGHCLILSIKLEPFCVYCTVGEQKIIQLSPPPSPYLSLSLWDVSRPDMIGLSHLIFWLSPCSHPKRNLWTFTVLYMVNTTLTVLLGVSPSEVLSGTTVCEMMGASTLWVTSGRKLLDCGAWRRETWLITSWPVKQKWYKD